MPSSVQKKCEVPGLSPVAHVPRLRALRGVPGRLAAALYVGTVFLLSACESDSPQARQYDLQGQILAIRPEAQEVLIKHGDIQNFMPGMTMPFKVQDAALLAGKAPGDLVTARLMVGSTNAWLATLEKTGTAPLEEAAAMPPAAFVALVKPGDPAPDTSLVDQDGRPVSLVDWRDSAVAVTFVYIRCPLPEFCPLMDRRFAGLQRAIQSDPTLAGRAHLLSVSFDPEHDTAARLKAHAATLGANPSVWRFATAPPEIVDRFAATFGVNVIREEDRTITHNLRTAVIGPNGRVVSVYDGSEWTTAQVLDDLRNTLTR